MKRTSLPLLRRRTFVAGLGAAAAWPLAAQAQQGERMRRVGVLTTQSETDREVQSWITAFTDRLRELGWIDGTNIKIDIRWNNGGADAHLAELARELIDLRPDALLAANNSCALALRQFTFTVPIVFTNVADAVATGLVTNLARPEGNITGFSVFEFSIGSKWIEALKDCTPGLRNVGALFDPTTPPWPLYVRAIEAAAPALGAQLFPLPVQSDAQIERAFADVAAKPSGAVVVVPTTSTVLRRQTIIAMAARHRVPTMYPYRFFVAEGGLMSYGSNLIGQYREAAGYVDRLLKSEKVSDLPVQQASRLELVLNLKTANALGMTLPPVLLARADEVIE